MLHHELKVAAVSVTNSETVLAHIGIGEEHHKRGEPIQTAISYQALKTGAIQVAERHEQIQCKQPKCPLQSAIIVPIRNSGQCVGLVKLYFKHVQQIRAVEIALAR